MSSMTMKFCFFDFLAVSSRDSNPPTNFCILPNSFSSSESRDLYILRLMSLTVQKQKTPVSKNMQTSITMLIMTVVLKFSLLFSKSSDCLSSNPAAYAAASAYCFLSRTTHSLLREPRVTLIRPVKLSEAARLTNLFSDVK